MKNMFVMLIWAAISLILIVSFSPVIIYAEEIPPNFKVAFIGDQGLENESESVLELIRDEGTNAIVHSGDLDYKLNPDEWDEQISRFLGNDIPYFVSVGNHDYEDDGETWPEYEQKILNRLEKFDDVYCIGQLGIMSTCSYKGIFFVMSGIGTVPDIRDDSNHLNFIESSLSNDDSVWSICSWHKNQKNMQVGGKKNEVGWEAYELCREHGAIIVNGHEHSYSRTKTLSDISTQTVDPEWNHPNELKVSEDSTFVVVSGLGGKSIRDQERCTDSFTYPYGCEIWASIYTSNQDAMAGALFCDFHVNGNPNEASCYFKNIDGVKIDEFHVTSFMESHQSTEQITEPEESVSVEESVSSDTVVDESKQILLSLKQQLKSGIPIDEIECKKGLNLILKFSDNSPACVKPSTIEKLIQRGWTS